LAEIHEAKRLGRFCGPWPGLGLILLLDQDCLARHRPFHDSGVSLVVWVDRPFGCGFDLSPRISGKTQKLAANQQELLLLVFKNELFKLVEELYIALMGVTNTAAPFLLISWGQQFIDSGVASILNGTVPLFTMVIAHFFLVEERMTWGRVMGLLTGFVGVLLLVTRDTGKVNFQTNVLGQVAVLAAAVAYAGSAVFARRTLRSISPILQSFVSVAFADFVVWLSVPFFESPIRVPEASLTWVALLWLGLLGTFLAYLLYYYLIQSVGSTRTMLVTYVLPVVGLALGVLFLGERVNLQLAIGGLFVLAGVWVVNTNWRPRLKVWQ
jgi:drug/metabolite transporter (DMT)-like permease